MPFLQDLISLYRQDYTWESEGSFGFGNYWREVDDLRFVIQHFSEANRTIRAIIGHSKGGNIVLLYASKYHDISTVINVSGRYNLTEGIENRLGKDFMLRIKEAGFIDVRNKTGSVNFRVTEESLLDRLSTDMHEACLHISKECRVLTVHGTEDQIINSSDAVKFSKIIPNHKLHIIQGCDHNYTHYQGDLASVVLDFIKGASSVQQGSTS